MSQSHPPTRINPFEMCQESDPNANLAASEHPNESFYVEQEHIVEPHAINDADTRNTHFKMPATTFMTSPITRHSYMTA